MQGKSAAVVTLVLLVCFASSASASTKVWYGTGYRNFGRSAEYVRPFFTTANDPSSANGSTVLNAVGVVWTQSFLAGVGSLPLTFQNIPVPSGNFNYASFSVPLTYNSQTPTGPNPTNTGLPLDVPFPFIRVTYTPSGVPTNGNTNAFVGVYTTPMWILSFHLGTYNEWNRYWGPNATSTSGPCMGLSRAAFNETMHPVAARCFPSGRYANTGTVLPQSGATILDLGGPEWSTVPGSQLRDAAVQYGQFGGQTAYLQTMLTSTFLNNQTAAFNCRDLKYLPQNLPVATQFPTQYCLRNVGATVVIELRRFRVINAGNCAVSDTNPPSVNSFFPSAFTPPYLGSGCLAKN